MLKVQILGKGLIPRIGTLAPITEPTAVTKDTIQLIFSSPNLRMNYYNETTGNFHPLTKSNYQKIWRDYSIKRTATGAIPAANPVADETPALTQEGVEVELDTKTGRIGINGKPSGYKPPQRVDVTPPPPPPVDSQSTQDIDPAQGLIPDAATEVKPDDVKEDAKPATTDAQVEEKPEEKKDESSETFSPIGQSSNNHNNNKKKNK